MLEEYEIPTCLAKTNRDTGCSNWYLAGADLNATIYSGFATQIQKADGAFRRRRLSRFERERLNTHRLGRVVNNLYPSPLQTDRSISRGCQMPDISFLETAVFWKYASMPFISGIIGYVTNRVAIYMMFHPIEFVGIWKPYGGWQGVIPRRAAKMAAISVDTITKNLMNSNEMFARLEPEEIAQRVGGALHVMLPEMIDEVMTTHHADIWARIPQTARDAITARVWATIPEAVAGLVHDMRGNVDQVFDLQHMVVRRLMSDKSLLNRIFQETGEKEFIFIGRSGFYFGFPLGCIQMAIWMFWQPFWLLPLVGMLVGWFTNWAALKMIFNPKNKHRVGPFVLHGLFFKRQSNVAQSYAHFVANEVLAPSYILQELLEGPYSNHVFGVVAHRVGRAIDDTAGLARPFVAWTVGDENYTRLKETAVARLVRAAPDMEQEISETTQAFVNHVDQAMDIQNTLEARLASLSAPKFEGMLRPAFEEDEWMLIAVGAALGFAVGVFQFVVLFGGFASLVEFLGLSGWVG